eukprot:4286343-Pyramimonas_sp.AAC.1
MRPKVVTTFSRCLWSAWRAFSQCSVATLNATAVLWSVLCAISSLCAAVPATWSATPPMPPL